MGWSIDAVEPQIAAVFRRLKRRHKTTHPESPYPTVMIQHEGDAIDTERMHEILDLFPDSVYVNFTPNTQLSEERQ